ncbi:DUF4238 domain-containing protein [Micromonospora haikouensis]|uniref:DUF4238 domain-containing protein n=1 Tax=Micromonospora haikouensis TaxID=686309 RepID=UPI0037A0DAFF
MNLPFAGDAPVSVRHLAALRKYADDNVVEQHVVARVVLKRWTNEKRVLSAVNVTDREAKVITRGPAGLGKIRNFVPQASRSAEQVWGSTEQRVPRLFRMCDGDAIMDDPTATEALRDVVALHYVRSRGFHRVHEQSYRQQRQRIKQLVRTRPDYEASFLRRLGRQPSTEEDHEFYFEMVLAREWEWDSYFSSGLLFRASVERMFRQCQKWMSGRPVQLVHPASGEFLIGDAPVVSLDALGRLGPECGVALGDATQIFMPLTPRSLVAFGPSRVGKVPRAMVDELNAYQVRAAHEFVFLRPGSNLESFVRDTRFDSA